MRQRLERRPIEWLSEGGQKLRGERGEPEECILRVATDRLYTEGATAREEDKLLYKRTQRQRHMGNSREDEVGEERSYLARSREEDMRSAHVQHEGLPAGDISSDISQGLIDPRCHAIGRSHDRWT